MGAALFPASLARRSWFDSQRLLLLGWLVRVSVNIALAHASNTRTSPAVHNKSQLYHGTKPQLHNGNAVRVPRQCQRSHRIQGSRLPTSKHKISHLQTTPRRMRRLKQQILDHQRCPSPLEPQPSAPPPASAWAARKTPNPPPCRRASTRRKANSNRCANCAT